MSADKKCGKMQPDLRTPAGYRDRYSHWHIAGCEELSRCTLPHGHAGDHAFARKEGCFISIYTWPKKQPKGSRVLRAAVGLDLEMLPDQSQTTSTSPLYRLRF